ncbi:membrane protein, predicted [Enterocytozoon bieneusi H348]|nr:membrane protein, predicted [Enterocytozoon bieneusi H348]|eukprot:XP_002650213.1 membrane protein, predicted [Enterocytozoon bieneusi H348]
MNAGLTQTALNISQTYVNENFNGDKLLFIRQYFDINNTYICDKLRLIIFPFDNTLDYLYKPDLYIPLMALITYTLCQLLLYGFHSQFHPEKLFIMISRNIFLQVGLGVLYSCIAFIFNVKIPFLSLLCFTGYRYFLIFIIKFFKLVNLNIISYILGLYFIFVYFIFYSRSLKTEIMKLENNYPHLYFVFGTAIVEIIIFLLMLK